MGLSFTPRVAGELRQSSTEGRRSVLVTGAAGNIGSFFSEHTHEKYRLRLMINTEEQRSAVEAFGEVVLGDLNDLEGLGKLCGGIDTVLHLAASPSPATPWSVLLHNNIIGTYNLMVAAKAAGCRRVVYASSIHAVSGYPRDTQVKTSDPVNPGDLYGVTKCFGEALGRYMAEMEGLSVIALRIGAFQPREAMQKPDAVKMLDAWVSRRDLTALIEKCIDDESLQWAVFNGLSNNSFKRLDMSDARELLGFEPADDFTEENPKTRDLNLSEEVMAHSRDDEGVKSGIREELGRLGGKPDKGGKPENSKSRGGRTAAKDVTTESKSPAKYTAHGGDPGQEGKSVRDRLARGVRSMPPEERVRQGR